MNISKNVFAASTLGAFVCWYDWLLFAICTALVFKTVFFPEVSYMVPLMVFAAGYVARPLGGLIAGNIADRIGRKPILQYTLLITACTTVAMGLLPNYESIGILAPILLFVLRIIQALSFGAELATTDTIMYEFHKNHRNRGMIGSFLAAALPMCMVAVTLMLDAMFSWGKPAFLEWAWRIPFLIGGVLFVIAWYVRKHVTETPEFEKMQTQNTVERAPVGRVLKEHWRTVILGTGVAQLGAVWDFAALLFGFGFMVQVLNVPRAELNSIELIVASIAIPATILYGWLGDRFNRLTLFNLAAALSFLLIAPLLTNIAAGQALIPVLIGFLFMSMFTYAQVPTFVSELFPAQVRTTGASLVLNLGAMIGGVTPMLCWAIYEINKNIYDVSYLLIALGLFGLASGLLLRRYYNTESDAKQYLGSMPAQAS
jgi:MFS family permease